MFYITKTKSATKPFSVVRVAKNGEVLSQHPLKTKQACWKNIFAQIVDDTIVQDDTKGATGVRYMVNPIDKTKKKLSGTFKKYKPRG